MEKIALYHVGLEGCNGVAFFTTRRLVAGVDSVNAADVILLDDTHPTDYDQMVCGSCKKPVSSGELEYRDAT